MIVPVLSVDDNTFLNERYRENIKATTPSGMFYDRDINGLWCAAEGVVYKDFNQDVHYISESRLQEINMVKYFAGVDFGYEHYGAIIVIGEDGKGNFYLLEEHTKQFEEIDYWVDVAIGIKDRYGNINFFCDSARPEHVKRLRREHIRAINADKAVIAGIEEVVRLFKRKKLFVVKDRVQHFKKEIYIYVWNETTGEPVKLWDDVLDVLRYAIYTNNRPERRRTGGRKERESVY